MDTDRRQAIARNIKRILAETERFSAAELADYQHGQLEQLARHAMQNSAFYRQRLAPVFRRNGTFDRSQWHRIPILSRTDVRDHCDSMVVKRLPEGHQPRYSTASSGTTGTPVTFQSTFLQYVAGEQAFARACRWYGMKRGDRSCIAADPARAEAARQLERKGNSDAPANSASPLVVGWTWSADEILSLMEKSGTTYYVGYATVLEAIAEQQLQQKAKLNLSFLVGTSMAVTERARELSRQAFAAPAYSAYTSKECHKIAHECPASGGFHVNSELLLVEIVDDEGKPCDPGELGHVVLTPFLSTAQPLIRYDQGDMARWGETCSCGRAHPIIARIEGRQRHQFQFGNGHRFMPGIGHAHYRDLLKAGRWQVAQTGNCAIEVRYMTQAPDLALDFAAMTALFRANYHPDVAVSYRRVERMPLTATGKFLDYVNEYLEME